MAITVPVHLTSAEEAALAARAHAEGVSVESLLHVAVLHLIAGGEGPSHVALTADQWEKELGEWFDNMPDAPSLSDTAISRESIYTREDEWQ